LVDSLVKWIRIDFSHHYWLLSASCTATVRLQTVAAVAADWTSLLGNQLRLKPNQLQHLSPG